MTKKEKGFITFSIDRVLIQTSYSTFRLLGIVLPGVEGHHAQDSPVQSFAVHPPLHLRLRLLALLRGQGVQRAGTNLIITLRS